jgi:hypothetical protein
MAIRGIVALTALAALYAMPAHAVADRAAQARDNRNSDRYFRNISKGLESEQPHSQKHQSEHPRPPLFGERHENVAR